MNRPYYQKIYDNLFKTNYSTVTFEKCIICVTTLCFTYNPGPDLVNKQNVEALYLWETETKILICLSMACIDFIFVKLLRTNNLLRTNTLSVNSKL